jgi:replicative DNA helicase
VAVDLALLRCIKYREQFDKVHAFIPMSAIDKRTKTITKDIGKYFEMHPHETKLNMASFRSLFFTSFHKKLAEASTDYYNKLLTRMEADVPEEVQASLINQLLELELVTVLANKIDRWQSGDEIDIIPELKYLLKQVEDNLDKAADHEFADIDDTTVGESETKGMEWCLDLLNEHYRNILAGDQTIVAARPGVGKSTFLTMNNVSMAQQLDEDRIIVWFNNESKRQRIMQRQMQSALVETESGLSQRKKAGTLNDDYIEVMGRKDRVRVYDIHGKNNLYLKQILESIVASGLKIGAIIVDMLDNVKFPTNRELREDQRLESMYQWLREIGVEFDCPTFPTSQVSNEGAGELYPAAHMLKESKTGKQGACDNIIMIGCDEDEFDPHKRGISMPKTKTLKQGAQPLRETIQIDGDRGVYK